MSVKQIRWHAAVLAATVIAVLAVMFALATVTSNAAEVTKDDIYDPASNTYTLSDGDVYGEVIELADNTDTTIVVNGTNKLTAGTEERPQCIYGGGNLKIIGDGTLELTNGPIFCNDLTIGGKVKLVVDGRPGLYTSGIVTIENAEIELKNGYMSCGSSSDKSRKHVFNNAHLKITDAPGLTLGSDAVLTNCDITTENSWIGGFGVDVTIDGGTYNISSNPTAPGMQFTDCKTIIKNAAIRTNAFFSNTKLEMTNTSFEFVGGNATTNAPAILGSDAVISGCKLKIDGGIAYAGIYLDKNVIIKDNTEIDIKCKNFGIYCENIQIIHSGGKIQATGPDAYAAIAGVKWDSSASSYSAGSLSLESVDVKEPANHSIDKASLKISSYSQPLEIMTILDGEAPATTVVLEAQHNWDSGKVTKQPTAAEEGVKTYTCSICGATRTEAIPKLTPQAPATGADGTVFGKGASVEAAEAAILALPNDNDPAGTAFGLLQLKATKVTKNSIKLKWKAVPGATKYILFANKCGTGNKYKKLGEVTGTSYTATQAAGAAIRKGTYYKFMMIAADSSGKVVSTSKTVHAATKGGKVGNHKKVTVKKSVTKKAKKLKKGKTLKLKAKAVPQARKLKVKKHRAIKYETSNPAVAKVSGKGTVKGVGKGTCYVYAYAQNGTCAKVKVTVK